MHTCPQLSIINNYKTLNAKTPTKLLTGNFKFYYFIYLLAQKIS